MRNKKSEASRSRFEKAADKLMQRMLELQDKDLEREEIIRTLRSMYALGRTSRGARVVP
jgi:hypothetical protein